MRPSTCPARRSLLLVALLATLTVVPRDAIAQVAPMGDHYGGRPSDTGFQSGPTSPLGGYMTSIPLTLPPSRKGLPLPISLVYTTHGFGAAGLGWDLPLSYVLVDSSLAHRRPTNSPNAVPTAFAHVSLSLGGQVIELVPHGTGWVGRSGNATVTLTASGANYVLYDGDGRAWTFTRDDVIKNGGSGIWTLKTIAGAGGSLVTFNYDYPTVAAGTGTALTIDLTSIVYNKHPSTTCEKNQIVFTYDAPSANALSVWTIGGVAFGRAHKLTDVKITATASCPASYKQLRRYHLTYSTDEDTQQPSRLSAVTLYGQPDASGNEPSPIPIASYQYGSASHGTQLTMTQAASIALPTDADTSMISGSVDDGTPVPHAPPQYGGVPYLTWQSLTDFNGDGRPDLVYAKNGQLFIANNVPMPGGTTAFAAGVPLSGTTLPNGPLESRTATNNRFSGFNSDAVWRQAIDFNGDGRIDIIDATEQAGYWVVYLNTPGSNPAQITWQRRTLLLKDLRTHLEARGFPLDPNYIPLATHQTGYGSTSTMCIVWNGSAWVDSPGDWGQPGCPGQSEKTVKPEQTFTEWELKDVNGDGFVDVVFNSSPVTLDFTWPRPAAPNVPTRTTVTGTAAFGPHAGAGTHIDAVLNVAGVRLDAPTPMPFSLPVVLRQNQACGIARWTSNDNFYAALQHTDCDLADINGDGLVDRIEPPKPFGGYIRQPIYLGIGSGYAVGNAFASAAMFLPISDDPHYYAEQASDEVYQCKPHPPTPPPPPDHQFYPGQRAGVRDVTGDGIPDYITPGASSWSVYVGTGGGDFAGPLTTVGSFGLSSETEQCDGKKSITKWGLFDIDGDGKPDIVEVNGGGGLDVYQLSGGQAPRSPEAGRLVRVDNGYGAQTVITYQSAKEDATTLHLVPFPEIVVSQTQTSGALGLGGTLTSTRYAYGGAQLYYDSQHEVFRLAAYRRTVALQEVTTPADGKVNANVAVTDTYPLPAFDPSATSPARYGRYLTVGQTSDVTLFAGGFGANPWALLGLDIDNDSRRLARTHYTIGARLFTEPAIAGSAALECMDMMYPYDYVSSFGYNLGNDANGVPHDWDACAAHGFGYIAATSTWRGSAGPPSLNNVQTYTTFSVDDYGRVVNADYSNDLYRADDDVCVQTTFATPPSTGRHVYSAVSSETVTDCGAFGTTAGPGGTVYAYKALFYDGLAFNNVTTGLVTGVSVDRRNASNGVVINTVRAFDVTYDAAANPTHITQTRDTDGAVSTITVGYDPFGIIPVHFAEAGTNVPTINTSYSPDPLTLQIISTTDANGTQRGATYDPYGRRLLSTITTASNGQGVMTSVTYDGFAPTDPTWSSGRRMTVKSFTDPVAVGAVATAAGRTSTVYLDELGRERQTQLALGADYSNETLVVGARTYDGLGRVVFIADPYPISQTAATAYGTTRYFATDSTLRLSVRGNGPQPFTSVPDASVERFPTLLTHSFSNHQEQISVQDAASLTAGTPQNGVVKSSITSAIGRLLARSTWQNGTRIEHAAFAQDRLGNLTTLTRYQDPSGLNGAVQWSWMYDSLGQVLQLLEPSNAPQTRSYSSFGELTQVLWTPPGPEPSHAIVQQFDAFGRLVHREEQNGAVRDAATVADYQYDVGRVASPQVDPTNVLGRLAHAAAPTGEIFYSYDGFGNNNARTFTDQNAKWYVEKSSFHSDDSLASLELDLPDDNYLPERVDYGYDSAGQQRSMLYSDGSSTQALYKANLVDPFGRVRDATYGASTYYATYADTGRRLFKNSVVKALNGIRSVGVGSYDAVGRELSRTEQTRIGKPTTTMTYDALGRLATSVQVNGTTTIGNRSFGYDALGNINDLHDYVGSLGATISYTPTTTDGDHICRISYGNAFGLACNVSYDSFGNVVGEATRTGTRNLAYYNSGDVRRITDTSGAVADFRYGADGALQELDVSSAADTRQDRNYGTLISTRYEIAAGGKATYTSRMFPGAGVTVSRRGVGAPFVFEFGDGRGVRFTADQKGTILQDVDYQPYGEATSRGALPGTANYTSAQWNGGDALAPFGLMQVGARIHDPVIGRFLSRDPLVVPRTAATTNPYAFAANDPVNSGDPTGLDCIEGQCAPSDGYVGGSFFDFPVCNTTVQMPDLSKPLTPPARPLTLAEHRQLWGAEPSTEAGRNLKMLVSFVSEYTADYGDWWDSTAKTCGASVECAVERLKNIPLSYTDQAFNAGLQQQKRYMQISVVLTLFPPAEFVFQMGQASNENEIVVPMLGYGLSQAGGAGAGRQGERSGGCIGEECGCFTAGTPVATDSGPTPIETVHVGDRVHSLDASACIDPVDATDCRTVAVEMQDPYGYQDTLKAEFMRSGAWVREHGVAVGAEVPLAIDELQIDGRARVTEVRGCTTPQGPGCVVSATVSHLNGAVLRLHFVESDAPLEPTSLHQLWSADRNEWVAAGELAVGERLLTQSGVVTIASIEHLEGRHRVYNFEVAGAHTYLVGDDEVKSHNAGACTGPELEPYGKGGGHHVPAKSAFEGAEGHTEGTSPAISNAEMEKFGIKHTGPDSVTASQRSQYAAFARTGKTLTWADMARIETKALLDGRINDSLTPAMARGVVQRAINQLKGMGVAGPTRIPWSK